MILITLGTQDKPFTRLLVEVDRQIELGNIKDKVVVQAGYTKYNSKNMEIFDLIDRDKFSELIASCDLLITHGGVGSILTGLKNKKKVIAVPRLSKYGEHMNDHQIQIIDHFYVGRSARTNEEGIRQFIEILESYGLTGSEVTLEKVLHLKTGVNYLER